jgi:hypothetical protein
MLTRIIILAIIGGGAAYYFRSEITLWWASRK